MFKDKNIFITGATGLLGSHLIELMVKEEANITILNRDLVPKSLLMNSEIFKHINVVQGQLEDYMLLERIINEYEIETVFHLGAQTIVGTANRNPLSTFESNIRGTYNLLEACRRNDELIKSVIVASSDKAYGEQKILPYTEDAPLKGTHPYDVSKSCVDLISQSYYTTYHLPVCITRCGNLFGAGDLNFNRIIPGTIKSVLNSEAPIIRSDGSNIRDYFYVKDGANAYKILAEQMYLNKYIHGEAFNFSNEIQYSVLKLVNTIIKLMGSNIEPIIKNTSSNEILHQYLSAQKAKDLLGWKPLYTLEESLIETIEWYKNYETI